MQTSFMAHSAIIGISSSFIPSSLRPEGMPMSADRVRMASMAVRAASLTVIPEMSSPMAAATSAKRSMQAFMLNSHTSGRKMALQTPWGSPIKLPG